MKTLPSKMTHAWLVKHDACLEHRKMFSAEWPDGADATEANLNRAAEIGLDLEWLAQLLLPRAAYAEYRRQLAPLKAEYDRQIASAYAEYERQKAPLKAEYDRQREGLDDEYERQLSPTYAEYLRQKAPLEAECQRQCDALIIRTLIAKLPINLKGESHENAAIKNDPCLAG